MIKKLIKELIRAMCLVVCIPFIFIGFIIPIFSEGLQLGADISKTIIDLLKTK